MRGLTLLLLFITTKSNVVNGEALSEEISPSDIILEGSILDEAFERVEDGIVEKNEGNDDSNTDLNNREELNNDYAVPSEEEYVLDNGYMGSEGEWANDNDIKVMNNPEETNTMNDYPASIEENAPLQDHTNGMEESINNEQITENGFDGEGLDYEAEDYNGEMEEYKVMQQPQETMHEITQVQNHQLEELQNAPITSDEVTEYMGDNEADMKGVEIISDGSVNELKASADFTNYKETLEKTKLYESTASKIKKVLDKYKELTDRQQALEDKILNYNKNQLKSFPFPNVPMDDMDMYVTKQEVLLYNHTLESKFVNDTVALHKSQTSCQQPDTNEIIQVITTQLDQSTPPLNSKIRILYLNSHTTKSYTPSKSSGSTPHPSIIFSNHPLHPFSCHPYQGNNGAISFILPSTLLRFDGFTIIHSPQDVASAPYKIKLYDDTNNVLLIDDYFNPSQNYKQLFTTTSSDALPVDVEEPFENMQSEDMQTTSDALQQEFTQGSCSEITHSCSMPPPKSPSQKEKEFKPIQKMTFYFDSNWGNSHYTCIYRLIVHGQYSSD